nr:nuclear transport factor 2 family protein [uncultured Albidiferax sp.]
MSIPLPSAIARYLDADRIADPALLAPCFTPDAVVQDEGHSIRGLEAIQAWRKTAHAKYQYTAEPLTITQAGDQTQLLARVAGNFPGSPIDLLYVFGIRDDKIAALEIRLPVGLEGSRR